MFKLFVTYVALISFSTHWAFEYITKQAKAIEAVHSERLAEISGTENEVLHTRALHSQLIVKGFRCSVETFDSKISLIPNAIFLTKTGAKKKLASLIKPDCLEFENSSTQQVAHSRQPASQNTRFQFTQFSPIPTPAISSRVLSSLYCTLKLTQLSLFQPSNQMSLEELVPAVLEDCGTHPRYRPLWD